LVRWSVVRIELAALDVVEVVNPTFVADREIRAVVLHDLIHAFAEASVQSV